MFECVCVCAATACLLLPRHNNHHAYAYSAAHGLEWWQVGGWGLAGGGLVAGGGKLPGGWWPVGGWDLAGAGGTWAWECDCRRTLYVPACYCLQVDFSYYVIRGLELAGLAWDVKRPLPAQQAQKRLARGNS